MSRMHAWCLVLRHPSLKGFIVSAWEGSQHESIYDLLFDLETEDNPTQN
jgi:hypothetical protein